MTDQVEAKKNAPPAFTSKDIALALWETKKVGTFTGKLGEDRVIAQVVNPKEGQDFVPFLSISKVEGFGDKAVYTRLTTANAVNQTKNKEGVVQAVPAGNVRRLLVSLPNDEKLHSAFIGDGLSDENFAAVGFTGEKTAHKAKVEDAPAEDAPAPK